MARGQASKTGVAPTSCRANAMPWADDRAAVTDVLGAILLVGITVVSAAGFGLLLFSFDGPEPLTRTELSVTLDPGSGGWGTGDETVRVLHRGGDALDASSTFIVLERGGSRTTLTGPVQLASVFADGRLSIGEFWQRPLTIAQGESVGVRVISRDGATSVLLADASIIAAQTTSTQPCSSDTAPPTVLLWTQTPGLVTGLTTGNVTVTAQLTDNCWGVNQAVNPTLFWRVSPRDTAYAAVASTNVGIATYRAVIPAQTWSGLVGQTLQYYLSPVTDLGGNTGATALRSITIQSDCSLDVTAPALQSLVQSPANVQSSTLTAVTVTASFTDDCAGVVQGTAPHLWYRINDGSNPAYIDATPGGMTLTAASTWQGTIPNPGWALNAGRTLEYYVTGQADGNGNVGTTTVRSDVIDLLALYTYPTSNTPTTGTVSAFANLQSASDSGAAAVLTEAGTVGSPTTQSFNANGILNANGWVSAGGTRIAASDDLYATYATNNPSTSTVLHASLANPVSTQGAITRVVLSAEVGITGYANDGFQLQGCLETSGLCTPFSATGGGSSSDVTMTYDITALRPGGGAWSWTDITGLEAVVLPIQQGTRDGTWRVDRVWADVTFTTTTHAMSIRLDWTTVPTGVTHTLDLRYSTTGDTYNVQVCTWVAGLCTTWNTRGTVLNAAGLTTWQYTLLATERSGGNVAVRFTDATPAGAVQGTLSLDYARVMTV